MATDTSAERTSTQPQPRAATTTGVQRKKKGQPKPFNFRRPNKFNRDHFRAFQIVHETFARQLTTVYSTTLRTVSAVSLLSVEECSYGEFIEARPTRRSWRSCKSARCREHRSCTCLMPLAMGIIERLLGGAGKGPYPERPLTDIESILMRDLTDRCLREMTYCYESLFEVHAKTMQLEATHSSLRSRPRATWSCWSPSKSKSATAKAPCSSAFPTRRFKDSSKT